jgi:hypothetical protein
MRIARPSFSMSRISILILALSFSYSAVVVNANATATSPLVQTLETQIWDASSESWKSSLWTSENDVKEQATSPLQQLQDKTGNWKILLRPGRDSLGWQYEYRGHQLAPNRRRVWLHKTILSPPQQVSPATETSPNLSTKSTKKRTLLSLTKTRNKLLNPITSSVAKVRDDFHFKGFGMSLYKSMLYKYSCGIAFRLPILANWDGWDRRPQLPSLSSQICLYYPPTIAVCVSSSINMEWWQYICQIMYSSLKQFLRLLLYQVLRGFYVVGSWLLYPVLRRVTELPTTLTKPTPLASPTYQSDIQERLGMTVSYRWSLTRGREWRVSYWHMYLPTIQVYRQCLGRLSLITPTLFQTKLDWCARHFMSLGVDTSAVPDPSLQPNFSCTALVSLSGLYLQSKQRKTNLVTTATAAPSVKVSLSREQAILPAILIEQSQKTQQQRDVSILFSSFASSSSEETAATAPKIPVPAATSTSASSTFNKKTTATATATSTKTTTHSNSIVPIARGGDLQNKYGYLFGRIPPPPPPPTKHTLDLLNTHD